MYAEMYFVLSRIYQVIRYRYSAVDSACVGIDLIVEVHVGVRGCVHICKNPLEESERRQESLRNIVDIPQKLKITDSVRVRLVQDDLGFCAVSICSKALNVRENPSLFPDVVS